MEIDLKKILSIDARNANTLNALGYSLIIHTKRYEEAYNFALDNPEAFWVAELVREQLIVVWSGGSFIYVPPGVKVEMPLQAYFRINAENMGQFERTLMEKVTCYLHKPNYLEK